MFALAVEPIFVCLLRPKAYVCFTARFQYLKDEVAHLLWLHLQIKTTGTGILLRQVQ